jgi:hypothetical protein
MIVIRFLLRFLLVPFGACVAVAVAVAFVMAAYWNRFSALVAAQPAPQGDIDVALIWIAPGMVLSTAVVAMLAPAALGALIAEGFAIRHWLFHAANGGLSVWLGWMAMEEVRKPYEFFDEPLIVVGAGIAAGFAYWAVAGWSAGFWRPVFRRRSRDQD